jgi:hypothetical protein
MKKIRPEIGVLHDVLDRLRLPLPGLIPLALADFKEEFELDDKRILQKFWNQRFLGWIFLEYVLYGGKTIPQLSREVLTLSPKESKMISNIEHAVVGFFTFVSRKRNKLVLEDMGVDNSQWHFYFEPN